MPCDITKYCIVFIECASSTIEAQCSENKAIAEQITLNLLFDYSNRNKTPWFKTAGSFIPSLNSITSKRISLIGHLTIFVFGIHMVSNMVSRAAKYIKAINCKKKAL